jgi:aspartate dehydrogenase
VKKNRIGFLGCGLIGRSMVDWLLEQNAYHISFVQDPACNMDKPPFPIAKEQDEHLVAQSDLVVEAATADVLKANTSVILQHCDLMPFSVTAFADAAFDKEVRALCEKYGTHIYLPHGAILGVDGIFDGRKIWTKVTMETVKNPKSLGRADLERTLVYEGTTREICKEYPRNVNVHASVALAGIGFDKTISRIISDPAVETNSHTIHVEGEGMIFDISISSIAHGGITGRYTPFSACGSLARVLEASEQPFTFV